MLLEQLLCLPVAMSFVFMRMICVGGDLFFCCDNVLLDFQTMDMVRNPAMLQELMRNQDRAMSNLEVH